MQQALVSLAAPGFHLQDTAMRRERRPFVALRTSQEPSERRFVHTLGKQHKLRRRSPAAQIRFPL